MRLLLALLLLQEQPGPVSPEEALRLLKVDAGLKVELVAAEPGLQSPVAMAFDEDGRIFVAEMIDYPTAEPGKALSRIRRLEDRDGDRRYETSTVYADRLLMANGVLPWKGGVIVTAAPEVLYLKDTDGDGRADLRETWFDGFAVQNPQLRASFPTLGIDNRIVVANGQRGGKVRDARRPGLPPVDIGGQDFRFDPIRMRHEATTGFGQFGLTFDEWGRRFVCTNRNHVIPIVMPNRCFARNPAMSPPPPQTDNQGAGGSARVYPISRSKTLAASHAGTFTASCGVTAYTGDALPAAYRDSLFTCEPTGNLVHQERLSAAGASFSWKPPKEGVEFLASTDALFRPVSLANGPDGALYVVDFCRAEVEHPDWVPADLKHRYDWAARKDLGRIWRIVPEGRARAAAPKLSGLKSDELVALLSSPNGWTRMTAHRLLLERQDRDAGGPLRQAAVSADPFARLHAAWLLEGHSSLDVDLVLRLLHDAHPRLRENAAALAEPWMSGDRRVQQAVAGLAADPDARVRFAAALVLGAWDSDAVVEPLARIALAGADDRWTRLAVASAVPARAGALLHALLEKTDHATLLRDVAGLVGARRDPAEVGAAISGIAGADSRRQAAVLNGLADGMGRRGAKLGEFLKSAGAEALLAKAAELAADSARELPDRQDSVRLLVHVPWETAAPALERLLSDGQPQELRVTAVAALSAHPHPDVAKILMKGWKTHLPAMRREVLEAMARRPERLEFLLGEVEAGRLAPGEVGPSVSRTLLNHATLKERAKKVLESGLTEERKAVIERYKPAVAMPGDLRRGRDVFQKNCVACHRIGDLGKPIGPDISDTLAKTKEALLVDVLDPSRVIDNNYTNFLVRTKAGAVISGFIAVQTPTSLTLRRGEGQEDVVLRADIDEMRSSGLSLMPDGLEKAVTVEQMADLLAFLKGWRDLENR